ncbi:MAG TPA: hypothetical protein VJV79_40140 [Polyangiaceae bacterium]|nr:hypothetical protein [Polyangiaceae bacterium]
MNRLVIVIAVTASSIGFGCQDEARCERTRMDLNKAWSELRTAATHHKLEGTDIPTWTVIENKAELLESSFMTRQVTWNSAKKASETIASKLPALESTAGVKLAGFRNSAETALKQQSSFEKECR